MSAVEVTFPELTLVQAIGRLATLPPRKRAEKANDVDAGYFLVLLHEAEFDAVEDVACGYSSRKCREMRSFSPEAHWLNPACPYTARGKDGHVLERETAWLNDVVAQAINCSPERMPLFLRGQVEDALERARPLRFGAHQDDILHWADPQVDFGCRSLRFLKRNEPFNPDNLGWHHNCEGTIKFLFPDAHDGHYRYRCDGCGKSVSTLYCVSTPSEAQDEGCVRLEF